MPFLCVCGGGGGWGGGGRGGWGGGGIAEEEIATFGVIWFCLLVNSAHLRKGSLRPQ